MGKKLLSFFVALLVTISIVPTGVYAANSGNVEVLKSPQQAIEALHSKKASVKSNRGRLRETQKKEEIGRRVIFKNPNEPKNNYDARQIYYYETGGYYILEYNTASQAKTAVKKLSQDYPSALILQDREVKMNDVSKSVQKNMVVSTKKNLKDEGKVVPKAFDGWKAVGLDKLKEEATNWEGGITVGVIDSGINKHHPLFKDRLDRKNSRNFAIDSDNPEAYDDPANAASGGHGTHVSGIIVKGTPKQVQIMAIRVFDIAGSSSIATITMGIDYAREKNVPVLNMSLGHSRPTQKEKALMNDSLKKSLEKGAVLCVASGNEYTDTIHSFPASSGLTMAIGSMETRPNAASTPEDQYMKSDFSNNGTLLDFVAPGRNIESAHVVNVEGKPEDYNYTAIMSGTSMATPFVAAEAAYVKWKNPSFNQWDVYATFQDYAQDISPAGKDIDTGHGYINFSKFSQDEKFAGKRHQGIYADADFTKTMDDVNKPIKLDAKVTKGDGKITYTSTNPERVHIDGNRMIIKGAGECEIIATASETTKYKETKRHMKVLVEKGKQEIKVSKTRFKKTIGDKAFYVKAKVTVGDGNLMFVANDNDVLDVTEAGKVTIKGKGTTDIFAIAGNTKNYNRCVSEVIKVTVTAKIPKKPLKVKKIKVKVLKKKKVKVTWSKSKYAAGYQLCYGTKKGKYTPLRNGIKKTGVIIKYKKLKAGKTYYFVVRPYRVYKSKKIYGGFSRISKVRIRR